jgi:hypothetical protein
MVTIDLHLANTQKRLKKRDKQHTEYGILATVFMFAGLFVGVYLVSTNPNADSNMRSIYVFGGFLIGYLSAVVFLRRSRSYELTIEETLFLRVYSALEDLETYISDKRELERKKAVRRIDRISMNIERWRFGNLKLVAVINPHYKPFAESFYRKVVGAIRQLEIKEDFPATFDILQEFARYLIKPDPKLEDLDSMTKMMNDNIKTTITARSKNHMNLLKYLREPNLFHSIIVAAFALVSASVITYVGIGYLKISGDTGMIVWVTTLFGIIGAYVGLQRRK